MLQLRLFKVPNMSFNAIHENKIQMKISEFTQKFLNLQCQASLSFPTTSSNIFFGLEAFFCITNSSFLFGQSSLSNDGLMLPSHLFLLVCSTTALSWLQSFVRRKSELSLYLVFNVADLADHGVVVMQQAVHRVPCNCPCGCRVTILTHVEFIHPGVNSK